MNGTGAGGSSQICRRGAFFCFWKTRLAFAYVLHNCMVNEWLKYFYFYHVPLVMLTSASLEDVVGIFTSFRATLQIADLSFSGTIGLGGQFISRVR